jgi:hypothetical protein
MSDSPSRRAVEKSTKKTQDVGRSSAQVKKPRVQKVTLRVPPLVPLDKEEEELPLQVCSPVEDLNRKRTHANYMSADSQTIINLMNNPCYESAKEGPDPHFWSYFHADWYRSIYESKRNPVVPMQWTNWAFQDKNKKDCPAFKDVIDMCKYHGLNRSWLFDIIGMKK